MTEEISFKQWQKLDLRVGKILKVEDIEGADKLYKFKVDLGELGERTIAAGVKEYYKKEELEGKKCVVLANLEAKKLRGIESQGMILAAVSEDEKECILLIPEKDIKVGTKIF